MRRLLLISLATIPLTGCQFFNRDGKTVVDIVESVESGQALEGSGVPQLGDEEVAAKDKAKFEDPTIASKSAAGVSADLIRSTDPEARARAVSRSRVDPFASLPIPPTPDPIVVSPVAAASNRASNSGGSEAGGATAASNGSGGRAGGSSVGSAGGRNRGRNGGTAVANAKNARRAPTPPPIRVQPLNRPLVTPSPIAALPTIPRPVMAPAVSVSGVIQLGNEPYAIVRSGSEPERYVKVGDRIAGGSVRVKRIETLAFEPRVVLEENGIEVFRPITGDSSSSTNEPDAPEPSSKPSPAPLAVPAATIPGRQPILPTLSAMPGSLPVPGPMSLLGPAFGDIPGSLLLPPAEVSSQAVLPNFYVPVPIVA